MKLLDLYSHATGLRIKRQWLLESFYPLPITRYITLHPSSGMPAKNYPYYQEVVSLLAPILNAQRIQVVQLGGKDDVAINGCAHLQGKTDYHQSSYILRNSMLHLGNDSWLAHRAGEQGVPLVTLFGSTSAANHSAYTYDPAKTVFIESHRFGKQPTFASQEAPPTIGVIPPEQVANAVLRLLGVTDQFPFSTRFVGPLYPHTVFELIPNGVPAPSFFPGAPMTVRMDHHFDPSVLLQLLQTGRKVHVVTNQPLDIQFLQQVRGAILTYTHELGAPGIPETPVGYTDAIKVLFPQHNFFTKLTHETEVSTLRFRYFDHANIIQQRQPTKADYVETALTYLNWVDTPENRAIIEGEVGRLQFKSNKYVLSGDQIYLSHAHVAAKLPITDMAANRVPLIDSPLFWQDLQHFLVTHHPL